MDAWRAASGCGSAAPRILTSATSGSGIGDQPLCTTLVPPGLGPADELDPVTSAALHRMIEQRAVVSDVPIAVAICVTFRYVSVDGDASAARALLRAWSASWRSCTAPSDVKIAAVVSDGRPTENGNG